MDTQLSFFIHRFKVSPLFPWIHRLTIWKCSIVHIHVVFIFLFNISIDDSHNAHNQSTAIATKTNVISQAMRCWITWTFNYTTSQVDLLVAGVIIGAENEVWAWKGRENVGSRGEFYLVGLLLSWSLLLLYHLPTNKNHTNAFLLAHVWISYSWK